MDMPAIYILVICSALLIYLLKNVPKNYVVYNKISSLEGFTSNPSYLFGHVWYMLSAFRMKKQGMEVFKILATVAKVSPYHEIGYFAGWAGNLMIGFPFIFIYRVELVKEILSSKKYIDKSPLYAFAKPILGAGLITSKRETWTRRRKLLNPTFHQHMLQSYIPSMNKQSIKLVQEIRDELKQTNGNSIANTTHIISRRIMAMLLETIIDCNEDDIDPRFTPMAEMADELMCKRLAQPWKFIHLFYCWTKDGKDFKNFVDFMRKEAMKLVEMRMEKLKTRNVDSNENVVRPALIDALITDHQFNPKETTLDDIVDEVMTFLAAGWDTTTWTASFTLLLLGLYPEVQKKVHEEIESTIENINEITMAETMKMKYLECVINESMRLIPLVSVHSRRVEYDVKVTMDDGDVLTIPGGTEIVFDSDLLHRNPKIWNDPDKFIPERFLLQNRKERDQYGFMPFSAGPRNCIGKAFGMMEDKVIIAHIVSTFRVKSLDPLDKVRMNSRGIARRTYDPLRFEFYTRN